MPEDHPLGTLAQLTPQDLDGHPVFILARRFAPGLYDGLIVALKQRGFHLQVIQELGEFTTMLALISAGMGIGILPGLALAAPPANVAVRELVLPDYRSSVGLAWISQETAIKRTFFELARSLG